MIDIENGKLIQRSNYLLLNDKNHLNNNVVQESGCYEIVALRLDSMEIVDLLFISFSFFLSPVDRCAVSCVTVEFHDTCICIGGTEIDRDR